MDLKFRILKNIFKQGFQGMWRNRSMGVASVASISAVLVILGLVLILILSINNFVTDTTAKFDEIQIFLYDDIDDDEMIDIEETVMDNDGVISIIYESRDQALANMKESWGEEAYLLEGLEDNNPLPDSYVVKIEAIEYADDVVNSIKALDGVEKVQYDKEVIDKLLLVAEYIKMGGMVIIAILVFISIFIISNTIKITVTSRSREINIMKYVGATNNYIRGPFVIEGVLFGLLGALISLAIVYFGYDYFFNVVNEQFYSLFSVFLVAPQMIFMDIAVIFSAIGIGIGALGSIVSMKRFLNV